MQIHSFDCLLRKESCLANAFERYFYLEGISHYFGCHKYAVIGIKDSHTFLKKLPLHSLTLAQLLTTCAKIISYMTIILPLLILAAKKLSRGVHTYIQFPVIPHDAQKVAQKVLSTPLQPKPAEINAAELRRLISALADTDRGFPNTPLQLLKKKLEKSENIETCHKQFFDILTPAVLRENESYLSAYRKFLHDNPTSSLLPTISLENTQKDSRKIDRLLAFAVSPLIEKAFQHEMNEKKKGIYRSDIFDGDGLAIIGTFIEQGRAEFLLPSPKNIQNYEEYRLQIVFDTYPAAHLLEIPKLLDACRKEIHSCVSYGNSELDTDSLKALWQMGETYADGHLKYFCLLAISKEPALLAQMPDEAQKLYPSFVKFQSRLAYSDEKLTLWGSDNKDKMTLPFCQSIGVNEVDAKSDLDDETVVQLKQFDKITLMHDYRHKAEMARWYGEILAPPSKLTSLKGIIEESDLQPFATALAQNRRLKELRLRLYSLHHFSQPSLAILAASVVQNSSLTHLELARLSFAEQECFKKAIASRPVALKLTFSVI